MRIDYQTIKRYLEGDEKNGDRDKILYWFSDISAEKDLRIKYHKYWDEMMKEADVQEYDEERLLGNIYRKIKLEGVESLNRNKPVRKTLNVLTKVAAFLFIPMLMYFFAFGNKYFLKGGETALAEIYAPLGTRIMFTLPDGSKGWLNSGSYLKFPVRFDAKSREVELKGEAYFDIKTNPNKPFIVSGEDIEVIAHGTTFNMLTYPDDKFRKVTLVNGAIDIVFSKNGKREYKKNLNPGNMFSYNMENCSYDIKYVDANKIVSWKEGKLVFRDVTFDEVIKKINRWYNVNMIIMDEELKSYIYMATFQDETFDEVLKLLKLSAPLDYKNIDREIQKNGLYKKREIEIYYKTH